METENKKPMFTISEVLADKDAWQKRHWHPGIKMAWNSAIEVIPGSFEKGKPGTRIFPDGTTEVFYVNY